VHTAQIRDVIIIGFMGDYLSLWKARFIVHQISRSARTGNSIMFIVFDIFASVMISFIIASFLNFVEHIFYWSWESSFYNAVMRTYEAWLYFPDFIHLAQKQSDLLNFSFVFRLYY
jgi:hypothetical protein